MSDDRLIVALDVPNVVQGLDLAGKIGDAVSFYKIGLGMLTGGGLALANELKQEHGKRIFSISLKTTKYWPRLHSYFYLPAHADTRDKNIDTAVT